MIIKLPLIQNDKFYDEFFYLEIENDYVKIIPYDKGFKLAKIHLCNMYSCQELIPVIFPMYFHRVGNFLISNNFMELQLLSDSSQDDFLSVLEKYLKDKKFRLIKINEINSKINLDNLLNNIYNNSNSKYENIAFFIINFYNKINFVLNYIIYRLYTDNSLFLNKKIKDIFNYINSININFLGINDSFSEHLNERLKTNVVLKKNKYYFNKLHNIIVKYNNDKSFTDIFGNNIVVSNNELEYYCNNFESIKSKDNLFIKLLTNKSLLINYIIKKMYKNCDEYLSIYKYFEKENNEDLLVLRKMNINLEKIDDNFSFIIGQNIIIKNIVNLETFIKIVKKKNFCYEFYIELIESVKKYYLLKDISLIYLKIIYYSNKFYDSIFIDNNIDQTIFRKIDYKNKSTYLYFMMLLLHSKSNNISRYFYDFKCNNYLIFNIMSEFINNIELFKDIKNVNFIKDHYHEYFTVHKVINLISWKNIKNKYSYFNYLIPKYKNINISNNKIKKIYNNPHSFFNYLKKEKDYIAWSKILDDKIQNIYTNNINLQKNDYYKIGKLIYLLHKVKNQDLSNKNYKIFLDYANKNNKLILFNSRINLKIKDIYMDNEINLGYLAKYLCNNTSNKIDLNIPNENIQMINLSNKYYKYKTKYILTKYKKIEENST